MQNELSKYDFIAGEHIP